MNAATRKQTIGRLARDAGVGIDTVRFYERAGLMPAAARSPAGYRTYAADDLQRLVFIRRAKALGFSLDEIAELLRLNEGKGGRAGVRAVAQRRLDDIERKLRELAVLRDTLARYVRACSGTGPTAGCPIIEAIVATPTLEHHSCNTHTETRHRPATRRRAPRR